MLKNIKLKDKYFKKYIMIEKFIVWKFVTSLLVCMSSRIDKKKLIIDEYHIIDELLETYNWRIIRNL
jgi:hypothetical protein